MLSSVCWKEAKSFSTPKVHYSSNSFSIWQTALVLTDFSSEMSQVEPVILMGEGLSCGGNRLRWDDRTAGASGVNSEEFMSIKVTLLVGEKHRLCKYLTRSQQNKIHYNMSKHFATYFIPWLWWNACVACIFCLIFLLAWNMTKPSFHLLFCIWNSCLDEGWHRRLLEW